MTNRLKILEASLIKKNAVLDQKFATHFESVKETHGSPVNDKRCGQATFNKWDKQNDSIRNQKLEVAKTENAIELEKGRILESNNALDGMPAPIVKLVEDGTLKQWRKHPTVFFVEGVDKARLQFKKGGLVHRYASSIKCKDQFEIFKNVVNGLNKELKAL